MRCLFKLFILFSVCISFGQAKDSIPFFEQMHEKSKDFLYNKRQLDSAYYYAKTLYNNKEELSESLRIRNLAILVLLEKDKGLALDYLENEILRAKKSENFTSLAAMYLAKGSFYYENFNNRKALINYFKADSLFGKYPSNMFRYTMVKIGISNVLMKSEFDVERDKFLKAELYVDQGLKIADSLNFEVPLAILLEKKAHINLLKENIDIARKFYQRGLNISIKNENYLREASIYDGFTKIYNKLKNKDSVLFYFNKQLNTVKKTRNILEIARTEYKMGNYYNKIFEFQEAKRYLDSSYENLNNLSEIPNEDLYNVYENLVATYEGLGDFKRAFSNLQKSKLIFTEIQKVENLDNIFELETKYNVENIERENNILRSKNELTEQQKINQRNQLLGGIGLTTMIGIFFFFLYRNRQKTAKKLLELNKAKSNFFANISHEFRTPLTLISGPVQKQLKRENLPEDDRHNFEMMDRNSSRLLSLVDQLLDISKIEAGSLKLRISKSEIMPFLGSLCDSFTFSAKQKHIDYVFYTNETSNDTYFDKDIIEKIVVNLLSNALKYTPNNGSIICNTIVKDNHMYFTIKNTGKGFSKEELKNIFERFYQINENSRGVGIGLALVKELVSLHKGKIAVESVPNEWTTFEVMLPINRASFKAGEIFLTPGNKTDVIDESIMEKSITTIALEAASEQINEESPILLIVDDNEDIRAYVTNLFKDNYRVLIAKNGQIGSELAIENIPDIIISDIMMPVKNGIELCNTLKIDERTSHIPIILLTAKAGDEHKIEGLETGADDYITKPFNEELLKLRVEKLIESRRKLQERYSQEVILRPKDIAVTSIDEQFLERLQKVLDQKLVESSFNVEEFSKAVGMSRMQLHRKLKALTGLSATEFVRSQRLKLAAQLLKKSEINVSQVGYSVGFNDHAYFSKCFKEMYHCTPSEYIKTTKE